MEKYLVKMSNGQEFIVNFEPKYGIDFYTYLKPDDSRLTVINEESLGFIFINTMQVCSVNKIGKA